MSCTFETKVRFSTKSPKIPLPQSSWENHLPLLCSKLRAWSLQLTRIGPTWGGSRQSIQLSSHKRNSSLSCSALGQSKFYEKKITCSCCFNLTNSIYQTWPKCGPPTYFCGPWTFFCYEKKQHIDLLLSEIWSKAVNKSIKRTKFFFCLQKL